MNLPAGTHLAYSITREAWYADTVHQHGLDVSLRRDGDDEDCFWSFFVAGPDGLLSGPAIRLEMFSDSWAAFSQVPEFFTALERLALMRLGHVNDLADVVRILDGLGAADETSRGNVSRRRARGVRS